MNQPTEPLHAGSIEEWLKWAETKVALSLAVSFFFKPPASAFVDGLLGCYREFLDLCGPQLTWYGSETSSGYSKASPKRLEIPFAGCRKPSQTGSSGPGSPAPATTTATPTRASSTRS